MLIKNLNSLLQEESLKQHYYICKAEEARRLFLMGFQPISVDEEQNFAYFRTDFLNEFLMKGDNANE